MRRIEDDFRLPEAKPLMRKAEEIRELVRHILAAAPQTGTETGGPGQAPSGREEFMDEALKQQIDDMYHAAYLIPAKIAGAEGGDIYDLRMENATLIRKAARELVVGLRGLEMFGYDEPRYFDLLREEVEEFRKLFIPWVRAFNIKRFIADEWGLFNPPGVNPEDNTIGELDDDDDPYDD